MNKFYFLALALCLFTTVNAQIITIPDANFKAKLLEASSSNEIAKNLQGNNIKIDVNGDGEIQESEALQVNNLDVSDSSVLSLVGIKSFTNLNTINCSGNQISSLDVSGLTNIQSLSCYDNLLTSLDLSGLTKIENLNCRKNKLISLSVTELSNLQNFSCSHNLLTSLDLTGLLNLQYLFCDNNELTSLEVTGLPNLEQLSCYSNQLTSFDLTDLSNFRDLDCGNNQLTSLHLTGLNKMESLICYFNQLTSLDVTGLPNLGYLNCRTNLLTTLNLTGQSKLTALSVSFNNLKNIDVKRFSELLFFYCEGNQLTNLDLSGLGKIVNLFCGDNKFTSLDISDLKDLDRLHFENNSQLTSVFMKNGSNVTDLIFSDNPNLKYICADDSQLNQVQDLITQNGYTNCDVNSYCSFIPGGTFYTIKGNNRFDGDNNGCDASDIAASNIKFTITDGTTMGTVISDNTGAYSIPVQEGTYTITPVLENPTYFAVSPASVNVTFPIAASPFIQDFCITPIATHNDLEISLIPLGVARPGFDVNYKLIYKNKGNLAQSGTVNLKFNDAVLDLVSASPVISSQATNNLSWDFTNLAPFETKEIALTLNVNTPAESLAVNGGDVLAYTATITSAATDETPIDNTFTLNQTVVNSFDPNDKTCLEGDIITPALIGEYVHYQIRFENTGTYPAQNIVVKDMIDLSKFDISTLVPTKASHSYITKISEENKVEFIFENINLPYDDANNDGYIAFKIKTKPTLVVGDSFENEANIYFDYNFPILTNKATSTFKTLGTSDFEFSNYFSVYPNPVNEILNVALKNSIEVQSIAVYDILGQLVIAVPNANSVTKIDVTKLSTGNYFLKMNTDKGSSSVKFIKN
jgi:Leucine-rich repeat (LRR) protein